MRTWHGVMAAEDGNDINKKCQIIPGGLEGTYLHWYPRLLQTMWSCVDLHDMLQINEDYR